MEYLIRLMGRSCLIGLLVLSACQMQPGAGSDSRANAGSPNSVGQKWVATWSASATAFGVGSPVAQPDLQFALPRPATDGVTNQTIRMVIKPDLWGGTMRFRFSNFYGSRPVTFAHVTVSLQAYAGNPLSGTMRQVTFNGGNLVTVAPGGTIWRDAVRLDWVKGADDPAVAGRSLLVSVAVQDKSGPVTWHGKAVTTSYLTPPDSGDHAADLHDGAYPYTSTSWYFLSAVDVMAASDTLVICAFGDSITDGTASTINGNDRWSNNLSRRLHAAYGNRISVVNQGIGGNTVNRDAGSAVNRLDRDVLSLSGLTHVVWLEGINDIPASTPDTVIAGYQNVAGRLHAAGIRLVGATITSALNPTLTDPAAVTANRLKDTYRKQLNDFIRSAPIYDAVADMDAATLDPASGAMKAAFLPPSSIGGTVLDWLHPNRAGYQAMAGSIDVGIFAPGSERAR